MNITKEAVAQLEKLKQWLKQSDEKSLDAFSSQNAHLVLHFYEMYQRFIQGDKPMNVIKPTETTPIYTPNKVIQLTNGCQDEPYHCSQTDDEVVITEVKFSPECGLSWNTESKSIEGVPTVSGEISVSFCEKMARHQWGNFISILTQPNSGITFRQIQTVVFGKKIMRIKASRQNKED